MNTDELSTLDLLDVEIETARNTGRASYIEAIMEIRQRVAALELEVARLKVGLLEAGWTQEDIIMTINFQAAEEGV